MALSFFFSASLFFLISDLENGAKLLPLEGRWQRGVRSTLVPAHEADQRDRIAQLQLENSLLRRLLTDLLLLEKIKRRHQRAVGGPSTD